MGQCKKDVTPLLMHWSYIFLALTNQIIFWPSHLMESIREWYRNEKLSDKYGELSSTIGVITLHDNNEAILDTIIIIGNHIVKMGLYNGHLIYIIKYTEYGPDDLLTLKQAIFSRNKESHIMSHHDQKQNYENKMIWRPFDFQTWIRNTAKSFILNVTDELLTLKLSISSWWINPANFL